MPISQRGEEVLVALRRSIEDCEARGVQWHCTLSGVDVDTTGMGDEYEHGTLKGSKNAEMVRADVVAREIKLHVGNLEVHAEGTESGASGRHTRVLLDGKPFRCHAIRLEGNVRELWKASIDFFPSRNDAS
jgi:hypothetical protein